MTLPDPPVRRDSRCVVCGQRRKVVKLKRLYRDAMATDPFCSSNCCRDWHGTTLAPKPPVKITG